MKVGNTDSSTSKISAKVQLDLLVLTLETHSGFGSYRRKSYYNGRGNPACSPSWQIPSGFRPLPPPPGDIVTVMPEPVGLE
jgi:hypothetical protein